jgi:hypothetical protein
VVTSPDVVGQPSDQALTTLRGLGAVVTIENVYNPDAAVGTVLAQTPAAGSALGEAATIQVATGPASIFLEDLRTVTQSNWGSTANSAINGVTYVHGVYASPEFSCSGCTVYAANAEYNLGRAFDRLQTTLGYSDTAPSSGRVRVEIFGDTKPLYTKDIGLGDQDVVNVNVTGVLRIRIVVTPLAPGGGYDLTTIFGDAKILGDPVAVEKFKTNGE